MEKSSASIACVDLKGASAMKLALGIASAIVAVATVGVAIGRLEVRRGVRANRRPGDIAVAGAVRSLLGGGIPGAVVTARRLAAYTGATRDEENIVAVTRSDGAYSLQLPASDYLIEAAKPHFVPGLERRMVARAFADSVDIVLVPEAVIVGRVLRAITGKPVPGARVSARGELPVGSLIMGKQSVETFTDTNGNFTIGAMRPGTIELSAFEDDFATREPTLVALLVGERLSGIDVTVQKAMSVTGLTVSQWDTKKRVAGVWVEARDVRTGATISASDASGADGRFLIAGLPSATYALEVRGDDSSFPLATANLVVIADEDVSDISIRVDQGVALSGRLDPPDEGLLRVRRIAPVDETADSVLSDNTSIATRNGTFIIRGVRRGTVVIIAETLAGRKGATVVQVEERDEADILVPTSPGEAFSGRVVDGDGRPVPNVWVAVARSLLTPDEWRRLRDGESDSLMVQFNAAKPAEYMFRYVSTNSEGAFDARGLAPGPYELSVFHDSGRATWRRSLREDPMAPVVVRTPSVDDSDDAHLAVQTCAGVISGVVSGTQGFPVPSALVSAVPDEGAPDAASRERSTLSGERGQFALGGLCDGSYRVVAHGLTVSGSASIDGVQIHQISDGPTRGEYYLSSASDGARHGQTAAVNESLSLRLGGPATLVVSARRGSNPVRSFAWSVAGPDSRDGRVAELTGAYRLSLLTPGMYQLLLDATEGYALRLLNLPPDSSTQMDFELSPWSSIRGRLLDRGGGSVASITVTLFFDPGEGASTMEPMWPGGYRLRRTVTDNGGCFSLDRLAARAARLSVGPPGAGILIGNTQFRGPYSAQTGFAEAMAINIGVGEHRDLGTIEITR